MRSVLGDYTDFTQKFERQEVNGERKYHAYFGSANDLAYIMWENGTLNPGRHSFNIVVFLD